MRILILSAFPEELQGILRGFTDCSEVYYAQCRCFEVNISERSLLFSSTGIGTNAAAITTTMLCEVFKPDVILFFGVAGGMLRNQNIGDIVLANKVIDADLYTLPAMIQNTPYESALRDPHTGALLCIEYSIAQNVLTMITSLTSKQVRPGVIVTSNTFPAPKEIFQTLKKVQASAIEMESTGVLKAAAYYQIPVMIARAISNLLDEEGNDLGTCSDALKICSEQLAFLGHQILEQLGIQYSMSTLGRSLYNYD